jgi:2-dehydropantoate 2-reductase
MRWAVMGAGATGGYFGALLARGGEDVSFIARGPHLAAIRAGGLRVRAPGEEFTVPARATDDPSEVGPVDVVLFAVKSFDTETAADACVPLVAPGTAMLSIQNGIDNEDVLASWFGAARVLGGSTRIEASMPEPGVVQRHSDFQRLDFGPWSGPIADRDQTLLATMKRCGVDAGLDADVRRMKWEKFVFLCPLALVTSATRATAGEVRSVPETRALFAAAVQEIVDVAAASGIKLGADSTVERILTTLDSVPSSMKTSMQRDLERGRRLELEAFAGALRRAGRSNGVATPVHDMLYAVLRPAALAAERPPATSAAVRA